MLLVYGWGRWTDIVKHAGFRRDLDELDVSNISQAIVSIYPPLMYTVPTPDVIEVQSANRHSLYVLIYMYVCVL